MKKRLAVAFLVLTLGIAKTATAETPKAATLCLACHGSAGVSPNDLWPNLAGQKKDYLAKQITAFRTGERKDPMMTPVAMSLSADDVAVLAAYFAEMKTK